MAKNAEGHLIASAGSNGTIRLWDSVTGKSEGKPLIGHQGAVNAVAFSPDDRLLASAGEDGSVRLWDVALRKPVGKPLTGHKGPVLAVAFALDGGLLASAGKDGTARLWDVASALGGRRSAHRRTKGGRRPWGGVRAGRSAAGVGR